MGRTISTHSPELSQGGEDVDKRRRVICASAASVLSGLLATPVSRLLLAAETTKLLSQPWPELKKSKAPSFEVFYKLSQIVTCREMLSKDAAKKLFQVFMDEPWVEKHISTAYITLRKKLEETKANASLPALLEKGVLEPSEAWFVSHLITTWYLGVYYHHTTSPKLVLRQDALMWQATNGLVVQAGDPSLQPGYWASKPVDYQDDA